MVLIPLKSCYENPINLNKFTSLLYSMDKFIPASPARYPPTNTPESDAITIFKYILCKNVKAYINEMDKIPNYDGYLEILNEDFRHIGKIDVQIKKMPDNCSEQPKYPCSLEFLSFCYDNTLPVFLILVDVKNEVAYWCFMNRELLNNLSIKEGSGSKTIKVPKENIIRKSNSDYLGAWKKIIENYHIKIYSYNPLLEEYTKLNKLHEILKQENSLVGIERPEFKNIHEFLDSYNLFLDGDFSTIKKIYYNSCWKLGIAYRGYSENQITYILYPIDYFKNDLQIREISDELMNKLQYYTVTNFHSENPIHFQPKDHATKLVTEKITEICDKKLLPLSHMSLFREIIFKFIDKLHDCLGLPVKDSYSIQEIKHAFYIYLPIWIDEVLTNENINSGYHYYFSPYIDPEFLLHQLNREKIESFDKKVKYRIENNQTNYKTLPIGNKTLPFKQISDFLASYAQDSNKIDRFYIPPNFDRPRNTNHIWECYSPDDIFNNTVAFFNTFSTIFDATIDLCFPKLKQKLEFFNDFDTLIVIIKANDKYTNTDWAPLIECFYLRSEKIIPKKEIKFYLKGRDQIPINRRMDLRSKICIDNELYTVKYDIQGLHHSIFEDLPMFNYLYETLKERMKKIFKNT